MVLLNPQLHNPQIDQLVELLHQWTGIHIADEKRDLFLGRIRSRLRATKVDTLSSYLELVKFDTEEKNHFISCVTTNETYFYRTPRIWEYINQDYLPTWVKRAQKPPFRAWSAACSSGEEAFTLALFFEEIKTKNKDFSYEIFASDISDKVLKKCAAATYGDRAVQKLFAQYPNFQQRYFVANKTANTYQLSASVRKHVKFAKHNLMQVLQTDYQFDLILLRNVLIYFQPTEQEQILRNIAQKLTAEGRLIVGESESLKHLHSDFVTDATFIYKRGGSFV